MNENYINEALDTMESTYEIDLMNQATGVVYPGVPVFGENTLGQILETYADKVNIDIQASKIIFTNKRTADQTSDKSETVAGLGLIANDVLVMADAGTVA